MEPNSGHIFVAGMVMSRGRSWFAEQHRCCLGHVLCVPVGRQRVGNVGWEDGGLECVNILREMHSLGVLSWLASPLTVRAPGEPYH